MVSVISGKRQSENGDCSLAIAPPRYKMRKVSAVRDFPFGCGPHAALINVCTTKAEGGWVKSAVVGAKCVGPHDVEGKEFSGEVVESQSYDTVFRLESSRKATPRVVKYTDTEHVSEELSSLPDDLRSNSLPNALIVKNPKSSQRLTKRIEESMSRDEIYDKSKDSTTEVRIESLSALNNSGIIDLGKAHGDENNTIQGSSLELCLLQHPPIPLCLVGKRRKYPSRKGVSAIRDFPFGCGCNVDQLRETEDKHLGQDDARTHKVPVNNYEHQTELDFDADIESQGKVKGIVSEDIKAKNEGQSGEGASGVMIMPVLQHGEHSEMEQKQVPEAKSDDVGLIEQACYSGNDERDVEGSRNKLKTEFVAYSRVQHKVEKPIVVSCSNIESREETMPCLQNREDRVVVLCLMSAPNCPWKQGRKVAKSNLSSPRAKRNKGKKQEYAERDICKREATTINLGENSAAIIPYLIETEMKEFRSNFRGEGDSSNDEERSNDFLLGPRKGDFDVSLLPFGTVSSSERGVRGKVREKLRSFHAIVRKLQQKEETNSKDKENAIKRIDLHAARILKDNGKYINSSKKSILGIIPGVEVGDLFHFRIELAIVGLHRPLQNGIDYLNLGRTTIATSIVASGGYANDVDSSDVLIYTGQGGNAIGDKEPEDQKLERGNLALKNSIDEKNEVRVIRGFKEKKPADTIDGRPKTIATYTYDGLYTVERCWQDMGPHGKFVYKFELRRQPGQPELAWKEVTRSKKLKVREGLCVDDISAAKETVPIRAINKLDDEKPPSFTYITSMMYPDWCQPIPPRGCDCKDGCSDSERCACAVKNGGEIPYNHDGAIVEAKPLVYECGPSCKCPPTCHNRVSQYGVKFPLEIFKTESRGWGVRCLSSIPSGSFICEYIGELLDDIEAEQRTGSDEYLFDIGQNYNEPTLWDGLSGLIPDGQSSSIDGVENVGFTIDAAKYGNIGRFINHSCSPNLYAQNVLYDHEDKRIPHVMLFAAENIPPLQELSYDYNYAIDQVQDSDGNIRKKSCYCGSSECTGRLY